jgi:hypothetical protein
VRTAHKYEFTTKHYDGINNTPVVLLASRGVLELIEGGLAEPLLFLNWDDLAITACRDGLNDIPIGVIVYQHVKWTKTLLIKLGYVSKAWRGMGVYRTIWNELVKKAQELEAVHIMSSTHVRNHDMRDASRALGRFEESVNIKFVVPPK